MSRMWMAVLVVVILVVITRVDARSRFERMSKELCEDGCGDHGQCVEDTGCVCSSGYSGSRCEIAPCGGGCKHGKCQDSICYCSQGFTGSHCQMVLCDCSGHRCNPKDGTCRCRDGYSGSQCEVQLCPNGCGEHGSCTGPSQCTCMEGWSGP